MKLRLIPVSIPMQQQQYIKKNGSDASMVKRLMGQMDRETNIMLSGADAIHDAEDFPNQIHESSRTRLRRLLDII